MTGRLAMSAEEVRAVLRVVADEAGRLRDAGVAAIRVGDVEVKIDAVVSAPVYREPFGEDAADVAPEDGDDADAAAARRYRSEMPAHAV